ncbi:MAG: hypothetical protein AAGJ37_15125 [Pseudomonadota bacterium]
MRAILFVFAIAVTLSPTLANGAVEDFQRAYDNCRKLVQPNRRLDCFDNLDLNKLLSNKPRFSGKHTVKTEMFTIEEPTVLRYHSDGTIFVLAIHDSSGDVIQNLHIGGGGEATYLMETPGDYFLQVNGSTTWQIWLEQPQ